MNPVSIQLYDTFQEFSSLIISQMLIKYKKLCITCWVILKELYSRKKRNITVIELLLFQIFYNSS